MNRKITLVLFFISLLVSLTRLGAQVMIISSTDGTEMEKKLEIIQNLKFSGSSMLLAESGGSSENINLSSVRKIYFKGVPVAVNGIATKQAVDKISIYPNPVNDFLFINGLSEEATQIKIIRLDGVIVYEDRVSQENLTVNLDNLKKGLYLVQINNQTLKFIKE